MSVVLATVPWHEMEIESVRMELRKPGGGLSLEGIVHPYDSILQAGLAIDPSARFITLDQLRNSLEIALVAATAQVCIPFL